MGQILVKCSHLVIDRSNIFHADLPHLGIGAQVLESFKGTKGGSDWGHREVPEKVFLEGGEYGFLVYIGLE